MIYQEEYSRICDWKTGLLRRNKLKSYYFFKSIQFLWFYCISIKRKLDENLLGDKHLKKLNFPSEINTVHKQQELAPSSLVLCQEKIPMICLVRRLKTMVNCCHLLLSVSLRSEVKAIKKKTYNYKPKSNFPNRIKTSALKCRENDKSEWYLSHSPQKIHVARSEGSKVSDWGREE